MLFLYKFYCTCLLIRLLPSSTSYHSPHDTPISQEPRYWHKGSDFIWKASRLRRWQTSVPKHHLHSGLISNFFYVREWGSRRGWEQEVMIDLKHLDVSKSLRGAMKFLSSAGWRQWFCWHASGHDVPIGPWQPSHHTSFCPYFFIYSVEASFR